jgi:hypothetical protein
VPRLQRHREAVCASKLDPDGAQRGTSLVLSQQTSALEISAESREADSEFDVRRRAHDFLTWTKPVGIF